MKIETIDVAGFGPAIAAMRNPMNSWEKSDSGFCTGSRGAVCSSCILRPEEPDAPCMMCNPGRFIIGPNDRNLSVRLQKAGPEHCKHLRMVLVWAKIEAPRYWWTEADTYRYGVEKYSCSTMHKITSRPLTMDDFENDGEFSVAMAVVMNRLNDLIHLSKYDPDPDLRKKYWRELIQLLPQSLLQQRTVLFSYAALRNIYRQREGHKLKEWQFFREWVEKLPESWMITE